MEVTPAALFLLLQLLFHAVGDAGESPSICTCRTAAEQRWVEAIGADVRLWASCSEQETNSSLKEVFGRLDEHLEMLTLSKCAIDSTMSICCFERLLYLDLSNNEIDTVLVYSAFSRLKLLNLSGNQLTYLRKDEFSSFPQLRVLDLSANRIRSIHWETFRLFHLKEMYLNENRLTTISEHVFRFTPNLRKLDVSGNALKFVHSANYFFTPKLVSLNLANNNISLLEANCFSSLAALRKLNLANNRLTRPPLANLLKLPALKLLRFGGNPIEFLRAELFRDLPIEQLDLSHSTRLRMVTMDAFAGLRRLETLDLSHCPNLVFVSPSALQNLKRLALVNLSNCGLEQLSSRILEPNSPLIRLDLRKNPLICPCVRSLYKIFKNTLVQDEDLLCRNKDGLQALARPAVGDCPPKLLAPRRNRNVILGSRAFVYCASPIGEKVTWHFAKQLENTPSSARLTITNEDLQFDYVLGSDAGTYTCSTVERQIQIQLTVRVPPIELRPLEVGVRFVSLVWNDSLPISSDKVTLWLAVRTNDNRSTARFVPLANRRLWKAYTARRLRPDTNYTFCLLYKVGGANGSSLLERCVEQSTLGAGSEALGILLVLLLTATASLVALVCSARCLHRRFHVWQEAKWRSRLAASSSGQSFLSSSASSSMSISTNQVLSFENYPMRTKGSCPSSSRSRHLAHEMTGHDSAF